MIKETMVPSPANLRILLSTATDQLRRAGIESPQREARLLAAHAAGTDLAGLLRIDALTGAAHATFSQILTGA
nr:hypothetical protein [Komagataeibacter medellinensis]